MGNISKISNILRGRNYTNSYENYNSFLEAYDIFN